MPEPEDADSIPPADDSGYLIDQYLSGRLSEDEAARLLERLRQQPELGQGLLDQLSVDALLRDAVRAEGGASIPSMSSVSPKPLFAAGGMKLAGGASNAPVAKTPPGRLGLQRTIGLALAACVALFAILGVRAWLQAQRGGGRPQLVGVPTTNGTAPSTEPAASDEPTTAAVAVLTRTVDATWAEPGRQHAAGAPLERGWLRLSSGLAEVEFFSGARVVLEGPGELQLLSPVEAYCPGGRLSAEVPPPAHGFRINTPAGTVVDLGTAFGLEVKAAGPEVHVFKGRVELHPTAGPGGAVAAIGATHGLNEGEAAAVERDGKLRLFAADAAAFTTVTDLEQKAARALGRRYDAWRAAGAAWNADPSLVARFDFEDLKIEDRTLHNRARPATPAGAATGPATNPVPGAVAGAAVVGCGRADGRWPGKGALEFRGVGDRVRLEVPGELQSFTLVASVRVDGLDRRYNSLMMSDAFNTGAVHWQVLNNGKVRLGIAAPKGIRGADYDSPVVFTPERFGQWVQLAVAYDAAIGQVAHYVDGRAVSRVPTKFAVPLRIGPAELGNWDPGPRVDSAPIRHFSGRMDEFAMYRRALSEAEIRQLLAGDDSAAATRP